MIDEFDNRYYHKRWKKFGTATGESVMYKSRPFLEIIPDSESGDITNLRHNYWDSKNIIKVESEKHYLELILKS
jgi:hypothetical protein